MPIVLGWRTDVGVVGGRLPFLESFIDHVLIRLLQPAPTSVWRRLQYHQPLATGAPIGWAVGMGTELASDEPCRAAVGVWRSRWRSAAACWRRPISRGP